MDVVLQRRRHDRERVPVRLAAREDAAAREVSPVAQVEMLVRATTQGWPGRCIESASMSHGRVTSVTTTFPSFQIADHHVLRVGRSIARERTAEDR